MGFFKGIGRILQGKPVFDENDSVATIHSSGASAAPHINSDEVGQEHDGIVKNSPSTFPVVVIEHFKSYDNGHEVDIHCMIKNEWHLPVIVQTVRAFNQQQQLGVWLQAEQAKEVLIYKGPRFTNQPGYEVLVDYKTEHEGDYFEAIHDVRYSYNASTKTYEVSNIQIRMPIRDIYG